DLDWKLRAILPLTIELQACPHWPYVVPVLLPVPDVPSPEPLRHEVLDAMPDDLVVGIAEEREYLAVRKPNSPRAINDEHGIRRGFECATGEFRGRGQHVGKPSDVSRLSLRMD